FYFFIFLFYFLISFDLIKSLFLSFYNFYFIKLYYICFVIILLCNILIFLLMVI
ncbi:hypothetical protein S83_053007, partial [Arachis hypogaea]